MSDLVKVEFRMLTIDNFCKYNLFNEGLELSDGEDANFVVSKWKR